MTSGAVTLQAWQTFTTKLCVERFWPGRCERWVRDTFKDGELGPVFKDGGGWLISAQAVAKWFEIHAVTKLTEHKPKRRTQVINLVQHK